MPMVTFNTNLPDSAVPETFEIDLTDLISESLSKPRDGVAIHINAGQRLIHGGTKDPVAVIQIRSIGALGDEDTIRHTSKIAALCKKVLGLEPTKVVIEYVDHNPNHVGFNGTSVAKLRG